MTTVRVDPAILGGDDDGELTAGSPDGARSRRTTDRRGHSRQGVGGAAPEAGTLRQLVAEGAPLAPDQEIAVIEAAG